MRVARRKARLEAQAKVGICHSFVIAMRKVLIYLHISKNNFILQVDAWIDLKRKFVKKKWGVEISYTFRLVTILYKNIFMIDMFLSSQNIELTDHKNGPLPTSAHSYHR